ncbi:MAG: carboxy terminal-processing peptidase [Flavobacteriaceae bacterium]
MKKIVVLCLLLFGGLSLVAFNKIIENPSKDKLLIEIIAYVLNRGHYAPSQIDDAFSENVYMNYLNSLDGRHQFFIKADINNFKAYTHKIDDQIKASKIEFFNLTHEKFLQRMAQVKSFYPALLQRPFDFTLDESITTDYENAPYAQSLTELKTVWRKFLKFNAIGIYAGLKEREEDKVKSDSTYVAKSDIELEIETRDVLKDDMKYFFEARDDLERKDYFSLYVNAIALQFDPHTAYLAPTAKELFDQNISGKFEGIGARLSKRNQEIEIVEVISGGPVWRGKLIEPGDKILKVAQVDETPVDVVGMRLNDVIKLIKGPKGTQVFLTIKKVDGSIAVVPITRDVIELEEAFAKSTIIEKNGQRFGLIHLPRFYVDFNDYGNRNAATDVKKEINKLKDEGVEGIVFDLRNNGGGSLQTVVDMAGYFIKEGPIVQVKSTGGQKQILNDLDQSVEWDGPLVIMVNEFSASASEILAAALQDYKRAIVLGSKQTFGKGTVQNVIDLNQIISNNTYGDLGAMKLTTDKFYRINGGSTQLEGVKSDVVFPNRYAYIDIGEKDQDNPLEWDKITPANFSLWSSGDQYDYAIERSKQRLADNPFVQLIDEQARWVKSRQDDSDFSLNFKAYLAKNEATDQQTEKFKKLKEFKSILSFKPLAKDLPFIQKDEVSKEKRVRWEESLGKDIYVDEAINVLSDLMKFKGGKRSVAQVK